MSMDFNIFILGGYGLFVWPAFIFTFLSCLIVYLKTVRKLKKYEYLYLTNYQNIRTLKIQDTRTKKEEALSIRAASTS